MRLQRQNSGLQQSNEEIYQVGKVKGNQQLNEELEMKATELEKLFAAHKLRVPGNQGVSSRRISPVDHVVEVEEVSFVQLPQKKLTKPSAGNIVELNPNMNIVELGRLNSSKGKLYDRYRQIRESKLREEWHSRRVQNEAKMKAMNESLERIRAVLKATSDQQESPLQLQKRVDKFRSFDMRSAENTSKQNPTEPIQIQDDYVSDSSEHSTLLENSSTRSSSSKKLSHSITFSSPIPRSSAPPIPRSSTKGSNVSRRRILPENPVGQSLPNLSYLKEDNTKHAQGIRKETPRTQFSHIPRSKSTSGNAPTARKDNVWRSQSMKKSPASSMEMRDTSPPDPIGVSSISSQKNTGSKPFLKKGRGIGPGAGAGMAKLKATMESENTSSEEESKLKAAMESENTSSEEESIKFIDKQEDSVSLIQEMRTRTITTDSCVDGPRLRQESERSAVPGSQDIVILKLSSQVEPEMVSEVPMVPSTRHTPIKPVQDSPAQSPASWSSRMHSPFSMESPRASPASWSSKSFNNLETDSPRTRKEWGISQNPITGNASDHQFNVTKGIKRFLNFGRKSRGTEGLADCISSTTSEGDEEAEDGRDLVSRSSDDLRKSRMGYPPSPRSYEASNYEGEFVNKEVQPSRSSIPAPPDNYKLKDHHLSGSLLTAPRSFFSLPSFRSKGRDLKPR